MGQGEVRLVGSLQPLFFSTLKKLLIILVNNLLFLLHLSIFVNICQAKKRLMNKFGHLIRSKREEQEMLLRHLSAELDIDIAQMSKIERGERTAKREHVRQLIKIFKLNEADATVLWLADQVYAVVADENEALEALIVAENEVKYQKKLSN